MNRRDLSLTLRALAADIEVIRDHGECEGEGQTLTQVSNTMYDVADILHVEAEEA